MSPLQRSTSTSPRRPDLLPVQAHASQNRTPACDDRALNPAGLASVKRSGRERTLSARETPQLFYHRCLGPAVLTSASLIGPRCQEIDSQSWASRWIRFGAGHASLRSQLDLVAPGAARISQTERRAKLLGALRCAADIHGFIRTIVHTSTNLVTISVGSSCAAQVAAAVGS